MKDLFTTDDEAEIDTEVDAPVELATPKQVRLLEPFNYRKEAVRKWTRERAEQVLRKCQQEERIALRRAAQTAKEQDGLARGQPTPMERLEAANALEQAVGIDETLIVMSAALYVMTDDETKRFAGYLIRMWRGQA